MEAQVSGGGNLGAHGRAPPPYALGALSAADSASPAAKRRRTAASRRSATYTSIALTHPNGAPYASRSEGGTRLYAYLIEEVVRAATGDNPMESAPPSNKNACCRWLLLLAAALVRGLPPPPAQTAMLLRALLPLLLGEVLGGGGQGRRGD